MSVGVELLPNIGQIIWRGCEFSGVEVSLSYFEWEVTEKGSYIARVRSSISLPEGEFEVVASTVGGKPMGGVVCFLSKELVEWNYILVKGLGKKKNVVFGEAGLLRDMKEYLKFRQDLWERISMDANLRNNDKGRQIVQDWVEGVIDG